jgi:hypothetical protein
MNYLLTWCNFESGKHYKIIGDLDTVLQVYSHIILPKEEYWNILELWYLGPPIVQVEKNGLQVSWWK